MNNFCKGFLVSRSYLPSILPNEKETAPTLKGSYQWCKRMFFHILPDFFSWPFSGDTSSFLTNALQMPTHWDWPSQFWFGCCGRCDLVRGVLTTCWAPGSGVKWSYLKRLNKQDTVVSDTFHSRSATHILKSIPFAAQHSQLLQWLTGNRKKQMENARLARTDSGHTHDSAKNQKAKLEALTLLCSVLTQGFQEKCGLTEILCVVLRFYCLTVMQ